MKILFLGTCACEPSPRFMTDLKDRFDKDVRRTSAMMIDEDLLVDCGMHVLDSLRIAAKDSGKIKNVLVTHLHCDHFNAEHLSVIAKGRQIPLKVFVREDANAPEIDGVEYVRMKPFTKYEVQSGVFVTGLPANHDPRVAPQHLLIEKDGRKLYYGCDGAWMLHDSFKFLKKARLDMAIFDCTCGNYAGDFRAGEHNSIPMLGLLMPSLKTIRAIDDETRLYITHLAPGLHESHEETERIVAEIGMKVAYDGLELEL